MWPPAPILVELLDAGQLISAEELARMTVLECGAGCGLVGLAAALLGAKQVLLTDLPVGTCHLLANAAANGYTVESNDVVAVAALDWSADCQPLLAQQFDLVLASECIYDADMVIPLLKTCNRACAPGGVLLLAGIIGGAAVDEFRRQWPKYFRSCVALEGADGLDSPPVSRAIHRITGPLAHTSSS